MPFIDAKCRLIVPDMKGYGRSTPGDSNYNWHTVARQILGLMDTLKIQKFYVVGHDWGALIGSVMVDDYQDRILGFVRMEADFVPNRKTPSWKRYLLKPHWVIFRVTWMTRMIMREVEQFITAFGRSPWRGIADIIIKFVNGMQACYQKRRAPRPQGYYM